MEGLGPRLFSENMTNVLVKHEEALGADEVRRILSPPRSRIRVSNRKGINCRARFDPKAGFGLELASQ